MSERSDEADTAAEHDPAAWPVVLPVALKIEGCRCVVVGAGPVGTRKAVDLVDLGARVTVVAPEATSTVVELADAERLVWDAREFRESDLDGVTLVFTATGVTAVDRLVAERATARGLWVNAADVPELCTFYLPAVIRNGPVVVAVSTSGTAPALAARLRDPLAAVLGGSIGAFASRLADVRATRRRQGHRDSATIWRAALTDESLALVRSDRVDEAVAQVAESLGTNE